MTTKNEHAQSPAVIRVAEMVGVSKVSWEDASRMLVSRDSQLNRSISALDLRHSMAVVKDGRITKDHVTANLAFVEEPSIMPR